MTNSNVFKSSWLLLVVLCIPIKIWMWTNSVYQLAYQAFYQWGKCETSKGLNVVVYWWWMQRNGAWKWKVKAMPTWLLPNFCVLPALSSHLSVFSKLCIMNTPLHFLLLLCQSCPSPRNVPFRGHISGLIKSAYHGWRSMMTSSEGPFLVLPRPPPNLKPTTGDKHIKRKSTGSLAR